MLNSRFNLLVVLAVSLLTAPLSAAHQRYQNDDYDRYHRQQKSSGSGCWPFAMFGGAVLGLIAGPLAIPALAGSLGFGAGGIAAGSTAATMMSTAATTGYGAGVVATMQSVGAAGLSMSAGAVAGGVGAVGGGIVGKAVEGDCVESARNKC